MAGRAASASVTGIPRSARRLRSLAARLAAQRAPLHGGGQRKHVARLERDGRLGAGAGGDPADAAAAHEENFCHVTHRRGNDHLARVVIPLLRLGDEALDVSLLHLRERQPGLQFQLQGRQDAGGW